MLTSKILLNVDPDRVTIGGFSAGASISAALALLARDRADFVIRSQIMAYPCLDFVKHYEVDPTADKSGLTPGLMKFFTNLYIPKLEDRDACLASPVLVEDLRRLPRAVVMTAERDLIRVDGNRYATRLAHAGVQVVHKEFSSCDHGFTHSGPKSQALEALELIVSQIIEVHK